MSEKVFAIILIALAIFFLWIYDTGRWADVVQVLQTPSATQQVVAQQSGGAQQTAQGSGGSGGGSGGIGGAILGGIGAAVKAGLGGLLGGL